MLAVAGGQQLRRPPTLSSTRQRSRVLQGHDFRHHAPAFAQRSGPVHHSPVRLQRHGPPTAASTSQGSSRRGRLAGQNGKDDSSPVLLSSPDTKSQKSGKTLAAGGSAAA